MIYDKVSADYKGGDIHVFRCTYQRGATRSWGIVYLISTKENFVLEGHHCIKVASCGSISVAWSLMELLRQAGMWGQRAESIVSLDDVVVEGECETCATVLLQGV